MNMKIIGMNWKMRACTGSGGAGFSFCWKNIVTPMIIGHAPRCRKCEYGLGSYGISPNSVKTFVGSIDDRSWIQPKNGACRISMDTKMTL